MSKFTVNHKTKSCYQNLLNCTAIELYCLSILEFADSFFKQREFKHKTSCSFFWNRIAQV